MKPRFRFACVLLVLIVLPLDTFGAQSGTIAEIRVHGNHTTPDADVRRIAALAEGAPATVVSIEEAERRLRASGRFAEVEIRQRFQSIADPSQILVIIVVTEHPGVTADGQRPHMGARIRRAAMWLPIVRYEDGYGLTYGARISFVEPAGRRSHLSVPFTWGGERRAAL
jgi:hypothetical protein